jgi:YHS domain-containing protein
MGWWVGLCGGGKKEAAVMEAAGKEQGKEVTKMAKDPVCGMEVDEKSAPARSEYLGKTYYFCAPACKKAFDEDPAKYIGGEGHEMAGHGGHKM